MSTNKKKMSDFEKVRMLAQVKDQFLRLYTADDKHCLTFSCAPDAQLPEVGDSCIVGIDPQVTGVYQLQSGETISLKNGKVVTLQRKADSKAVQFFQKRANKYYSL